MSEPVATEGDEVTYGVIESPDATVVPGASDVVEPSDAPETSDTDKTADSGRRGRPRPDEVVSRDELVFDAVGSDKLTRKQVAELTGIKESHVYLSLLRLRNAGRLRLQRAAGGHMWSRVPSTESVSLSEPTE